MLLLLNVSCLFAQQKRNLYRLVERAYKRKNVYIIYFVFGGKNNECNDC